VVRDAAGEKDLLAPLARVLDKVQMPGLGATLLDLYLSLAPEQRELLDPVLVHHGLELRAALLERPEVDPVERLVLMLLTGRPVDEVYVQLLELPADRRPVAVSRLMDEEALVRRVPWREWLAEDPQAFASLAAEAAARFDLRDLLPGLRELALRMPSAPLLRTLGDLEDGEAVPLLLDLAVRRADLRLVALESLGKIGGGAARAGLRAATGFGATIPEARVAFRALAVGAGPEDAELFLRAASHPDWYVRLAAVDALARCERKVGLAALTRLAADPVAAVAHHALSALEA
jgi:HEAT repeat protein